MGGAAALVDGHLLVQRSARAHLNGPLDLCPADLGVDGPADVVDGEIIEDLDIPGVHVDLNVGEVRVGHAGVCGVFELIGGEHLALELTVAVLHDLGIAPAVFSIGERTILCRKRSGADIVEVTDRVLQFLDEPLRAEQGGLSQNESRAAGKAAGIKGRQCRVTLAEEDLLRL